VNTAKSSNAVSGTVPQIPYPAPPKILPAIILQTDGFPERDVFAGCWF